MQRRSTVILLIGVLTLVLGAATTFAAVRGPKRANAAAPVPQATTANAGEPGGFVIPEGKQAIAVALDPVAGTAGIAKVGDKVNVFAAVGDKDKAAGTHHAAKLIIQGVEVLRVAAAGIGSVKVDQSAGTPNGKTTFVLAVTAVQAERIVYHGAFSSLWFSVVPTGQAPVPSTPGVDVDTQLQAV